MEKVYAKIKEALDKKEEFVVARILNTNGSVPRKAGTLMMLDGNGNFYGTVGGGSTEKEAQEECLTAMKHKKSCLKSYNSCHGTADDGMICGGSMRIEFIYVDSDNQDFRDKFDVIMDEIDKAVIRVWIIGAGHVAQALAPLLESLSFECHIVDDRKELLNPSVFPKVTKFHFIDFKEISDVLLSNITQRDFICIMTKGHKDDYAALIPSLKSPAFYVGLMGSRSKIRTLYQNLAKEGFSEKEIEKCHSPIGVKISAETPLEVAISIAGELIYHRSVLEGRNKY